MKKVFTSVFAALFCCCFSTSLKAQVGINTESPDTSSYLEVEGNAKGFLPPRLTDDDRSVLDNLGATDGPATGLVIYNKTANALQVNNGTKSSPNWVSLGEGGNSTADNIWFYLPVTPISMTSGVKTLELYPIYETQLKNKLGLNYTEDQLEFIILDYDSACFTTVSITEGSDGSNNMLVYIPKPSGVTDASYLNIAIKVKQ